MSSSNLVRLGYKKEATYGVTPAAVKSLLVVQDITYTAKKGGESGDDISIEYLAGGTAGSEVVTVTNNKISVQIDTGVSTATQVNTAIGGSAAALALITRAITGVGATAQVAAAETNLAGGDLEFKTARYTSEKYSGTPDTTESAQIRQDRLSSGQVVTGLKVDGGHSFELAKEEALEDFLESAMFNPWVQSALKNGTFSLNLTTKKMARTVGSFIDDGVVAGDFIQLSNFAVAGNNAIIMANAVSALEIDFNHPTGMVTAVAEAASYQVGDKLTIGTTKKSLTVEKTFLDLTDKALIYRGALVSQMSLKVEYGSLISGSFETQGNDYDNADTAAEFASFGEYFGDAATTSTMNGSVDMPFIATDVTGTWDQDAFCLQSANISLNNNLTVQNCIGRASPENYNPGTAQVGVDLSSYLKDSNWDLLARKLSQAPFALGFMVQNVDGWYGFYLPALQVSFDDPASGGQNQDISMDMKGVAKVGANGESALAIYRAPT